MRDQDGRTLALTRPSDTLSPSAGERAGVRILRNEEIHALNPYNLKMRKSLISKVTILRFMGRALVLNDQLCLSPSTR